MKKLILCLMAVTLGLTVQAYSQETVFTGSVLVYGSGFNTRTQTSTFTLRISGETSNEDTARFISVLQSDGQDGLLRSLDKKDKGRFSIGSNVGRELKAVRITNVDGKKRIRAIFERWQGFGELRGGYRSVDYPFGYVDLIVDPRTGKGDGTFIGAAQIRFREKTNQIEIEDFGTYPGRLMGVTMRGRRLP